MNSTCPAPFIRTKFASNTTVISLLSERRLCWKVDCCLPCIYNKVIYDTAAFDTVLYVSTISMCLMLLHLLLLLLFPITFVRTKYSMGLSVALIFFHAPEAIGLIAGKNNVLCNDATQPASGDTNLLCLLQGSMVVYGVMSTHAWGAMRICALYSALAFKKVLTGKAVTLSMTFVCSVLPLVPVMVGIAFHANGYHGGHLCMPAQTIRGFLTMWIPITMIATPVIIIHFMTFFKIARTFRNRKARQGTVGPSVFAGRGVDPAQDEKGRLARLASNRPVENSVLAFWALEWRPFISMSMVATISPMFLYFAWNVIRNGDDWKIKTMAWIKCLAESNGDLERCKSHVTWWVAQLKFLSFGVLYHACVGIVIFIVEVSKALIPALARWLTAKRHQAAGQ